MTCAFRIPLGILQEIHADLDREHSFAAERVGFLEVRIGNRDGDESIVLATHYVAVPDEDYQDDPEVGARIAGAAIRHSVERVLAGDVGLMHVHRHDHPGPPRFSGVDRAEIPRIVSSWRVAAPERPHGALLLSLDRCAPAIWLPGSRRPSANSRVCVVGRPMRIYSAAAP